MPEQASDLTPRFTLPNALSAIRIPLAAAFAYAFLAHLESEMWMYVAFALAGASLISDWADGYLARKMGIGSDFGKLFDPLADAAFFVVVFFAIGFAGVYHWALALPFLVRECVQHLYIRRVALKKGVALGAKWIGKIKTTVQSAAVLLICLLQAQVASSNLGQESATLWAIVLTLLSGVLSIASILPYFQALKAIDDKKAA